MYALTQKRRASFALLLWLTAGLLVAYFLLGARKTLHAPLNRSPLTPRTSSRLQPKFSSTVSLDSDNDGIPDSAELHSFNDRENFRRWFRFIAEMQFYQLSEEWNAQQRDCAGLVRFAWREALRQHDSRWLSKMGPGYEVIAPDVASYNLDQGVLGEKLFRTDFGSYQHTDLLESRFSEFADARTLKSFNCEFVSRERQEAQPGDLLFFYQPWVQRFPYHVMIFLGQPQVGVSEGGRDWVVYHTGSSATDKGTVKKVQLAVLDNHPDRRWRPIESNRNFLGFYRLKILE